MASKDIIKYQWETGQSGNMKSSEFLKFLLASLKNGSFSFALQRTSPTSKTQLEC